MAGGGLWIGYQSGGASFLQMAHHEFHTGPRLLRRQCSRICEGHARQSGGPRLLMGWNALKVLNGTAWAHGSLPEEHPDNVLSIARNGLGQHEVG